MKTLYTASAASTGEGRDGRVTSLDGVLDVPVRLPKELGGEGGATNPEQLFAAGYAACFHSALKLVAAQQQVDATDSEVIADVFLGANADGTFGLAARLEVSVPHADTEAAERLVERAHEVCPYSNATRGNIEVALVVA